MEGIKKLRLIAWVLAAGFLVGGNAYAEESATDGKTIGDRDVVKVDKDERICKRVAQTGTRFKKKVCMKASKWAEMQRDSQDTLRAIAGPAGNSG